MPHLPAAAILIYLDRPHPDRQEAIGLAFAAARGLRVAAICRNVDAAIALVLSGFISVVISTLDPHDGGAIGKAGAQLFVVRRDDAPKRRTVDRLIRRLTETGLDTQQIATALELDPAEVRRVRRANRST